MKGSDYVRKATSSEKKAMAKKEGVTEGEPKTALPVSDFEEYREVIDLYCHEYRELSEKMKELEARRKELSEVLYDVMREVRYDSIVGDNYHIVRVIQTRRPLSETKLVELGVDPDVIDRARGEVTTDYVQVRAFNGLFYETK